MSKDAGMRKWEELPCSERTRLLEAFGRYQDQLPPSCSLDLKIERFRGWLELQGIEYRHPR